MESRNSNKLQENTVQASRALSAVRFLRKMTTVLLTIFLVSMIVCILSFILIPIIHPPPANGALDLVIALIVGAVACSFMGTTLTILLRLAVVAFCIMRFSLRQLLCVVITLAACVTITLKVSGGLKVLPIMLLIAVVTFVIMHVDRQDPTGINPQSRFVLNQRLRFLRERRERAKSESRRP